MSDKDVCNSLIGLRGTGYKPNSEDVLSAAREVRRITHELIDAAHASPRDEQKIEKLADEKDKAEELLLHIACTPA